MLREIVDRPISFEAQLADFALVTHAVPATRVRPLLPRGIELETFTGPDGAELARVSASCFQVQGFRWRLLPTPLMDFVQSSYRTYVRVGEKPAAYFFGAFLSTYRAAALQGALARDAYPGRFHVKHDKRSYGYELYTCDIRSDRCDTYFRIRAMEAADDELAQQLTYRLHGIFRGRGGILFDQVVRHPHLHPWGGELLTGRFGLWESLGILRPDEMGRAESVLIQPSVTFTFFPPFPAALVPRAKALEPSARPIGIPGLRRAGEAGASEEARSVK